MPAVVTLKGEHTEHKVQKHNPSADLRRGTESEMEFARHAEPSTEGPRGRRPRTYGGHGLTQVTAGVNCRLHLASTSFMNRHGP